MSEFAQQQLEKFVPILELLQRIELLKPAEIKVIVKKCKGYEYKLQKKQKVKGDFLQYAQYLIHFLALIRKRREALGFWFKKEETDYAIAQKIDSVYRSACVRFQSDVKLWLSRIDFAKQRGVNHEVSKIFLRMLQVHTGKPHLWIAAGKFELEENHSVENGRNLLQRALRFHPNSQKIWLELFRMELMNVDKLMKRKSVLEADSKTATDDVAVDPLLQGKLAEIVFQQAMTSVKSEGVKFCLAFLSIASEFPFAENLEQKIFNYAEQNFTESEEMWNLAAQRMKPEEVGESSRELHDQRCRKVFEDAVVKLNTAKMWAYYVDYCADQYRKLIESDCAKHLVTKTKTELIDVITRFSREHLLPRNYFLLWVEVAGEAYPIQSKILGAALTAYPNSFDLHKALLCSAMRTGQPAKVVQKVFVEAVTNIPEKDSFSMWELMLTWCSCNHPDKVEKLIQSGLNLNSETSCKLKEFYLKFIFCSGDKLALRKLFKQLSTMIPNSLTFYRIYIEFESENRDNESAAAVRMAYEAAVTEHGKEDSKIWDEFYTFESSNEGSNSGNASKIYARAVSTLNPKKSEEFIQLVTLRKAGA